MVTIKMDRDDQVTIEQLIKDIERYNEKVLSITLETDKVIKPLKKYFTIKELKPYKDLKYKEYSGLLF